MPNTGCQGQSAAMALNQRREAASPSAAARRRFARSPSGWSGSVLVLLFVVGGLLADLLAPYDPYALGSEGLARPGARHWMGTDNLGRDLLSRMLHGARASLGVAMVSIGLAMIVGVPVGLAAGYWGGWADTLLMRGIDVLMALPGILLAVVIWAVLGAGLSTIVIAVGVINIPTFARQMRAEVLGVRTNEYVIASRAAGASAAHILCRAVLPNVTGALIVLLTLGLGTAILEAAGLSFLGLSGEPSRPEWGYMLRATFDDVREHPWVVVAPGAAISLTVLGFNLLGDALRDALDPNLR